MVITPSVLDAIFYSFDTRFQSAFAGTKAFNERIATMVPSSGKSNRYAWMSKLPRLRKWLGERQIQNVASRGYTLDNDPYELTVKVDRDDIEDDNIGVYNPLVAAIGEQAKKWPDDLLVTALQAGATTNCWDGQYFFDTDHPVNYDDSSLSTYSNNFTSRALTLANYDYVRTQMMNFKGDDNRPLGIMPNLIVVPPALEMTARQILNSDFIAPGTAFALAGTGGSSTNVLKGSADILVVPELANEATTWYLMDTARPIMPFVWQLRRALQFTALTAPTADNVFFHKEYIYGVEGRGAVGYTLPFLAARAIA